MDAGEVYSVGSMRRSSDSIWRNMDDVFSRSQRDEDDEEALRWAALERLPTYNRITKGILVGAEGESREVDIRRLGHQERKNLMERLVRIAEEDNEKFLLKLKNRMNRVGLDLPTIQVRFEHLTVGAEAYVGSRGVPTLLNSAINILETVANWLHILPSRKRPISILHDVSGIVRSCRWDNGC